MITKEAQHVGGTEKKSRVERRAAVVEVDRLGAQHIFDVPLSCAPLTKQTHNYKQATT